MKRYLPWILTGVFALWFLSTLRAPRYGAMDLHAFAELPVVFNGRHQPMDSLARNSLVQIRDRYQMYDRVEERRLTATEWMAEVMMKPEVADNRRAFRIDHPDLISLLKLPAKGTGTGQPGESRSWGQIGRAHV